MFSIFDCRTKERVSERVYAACEEASHDYYLNRGHTFVGAIPCICRDESAHVDCPRQTGAAMSHIVIDSMQVASPRPFPSYEQASWMARSMNATLGIEYSLQLGQPRFYVMSLDEVRA